MQHQLNSHSPEVSYHPEHKDGQVKKIIRTTIILSVITIIELGLGFAIYFMTKAGNIIPGLFLFFKGAIVILSLLKAFYIVGVFMHLGDEIRNCMMTIIVPLLLFIWFIAAFLWDGNAWKNLRNTEAGSKPATEQHAAPHGAQKPGAE